jgi:hypothetical protein
MLKLAKIRATRNARLQFELKLVDSTSNDKEIATLRENRKRKFDDVKTEEIEEEKTPEIDQAVFDHEECVKIIKAELGR